MEKELEIIKKNKHLVENLYKYIKETLGFQRDASIVFLVNKKNAENPLGKTAYYSPEENKVSVYITNRHFKDIMRSLAHELIHHAQNCRNEFSIEMSTNEGYAQQDEHLREMEREAYTSGNMMFRDWEDGIKSQNGEN